MCNNEKNKCKPKGDKIMQLLKEGYTLCFEEDFSGGAEKNKWVALDETVKAHSAKKDNDFVPTHVITQSADKHEGSKMHYNPQNVEVKDGALVITAKKDGDGFEGGKAVCNGVVFAGGYVEVEVEFPKFQKGVWPIFGLTSTDGNKHKVAYDIAAIQGDRAKNAFNMYIKWVDEIYEVNNSVNCLYGKPKRFCPDIDSDEVLSEGVHKFGIELTEEFIVFYCDGAEWNRIDVTPLPYAIFGKKKFLKFTAQLSVGLPNIEAPEENIQLPTEFKILNIKVYQRDGDILIKR